MKIAEQLQQLLTRRCSKCGIEKSVQEYSPDKRHSYGLQSQCKSCKNEQLRTVRNVNKEQINQRQRERNAKPENKAQRSQHGKERRSRPEVQQYLQEYGKMYYRMHKDDQAAEYEVRRESPQEIARQLWQSAKSRAKKGNSMFNLTPEYVLSIFPNPFVCPLLNVKLKRGKGRVCGTSPTLDRINPNRGYTQGNVAVISFKANTIKSNATAKELILIGRNLEQLLKQCHSTKK